jgi:hypothetical protein
VNLDDRDQWLVLAGAANLPSGNPYLLGDANLDGVVDGSDFGIWNSSKFTLVAQWCSGDFSADGVVDGSDFGIWNANKFTSSDSGRGTVEIGTLAPDDLMVTARVGRRSDPLGIRQDSVAADDNVPCMSLVDADRAELISVSFASKAADNDMRERGDDDDLIDAIFAVWEKLNRRDAEKLRAGS